MLPPIQSLISASRIQYTECCSTGKVFANKDIETTYYWVSFCLGLGWVDWSWKWVELLCFTRWFGGGETKSMGFGMKLVLEMDGNENHKELLRELRYSWLVVQFLSIQLWLKGWMNEWSSNEWITDWLVVPNVSVIVYF